MAGRRRHCGQYHLSFAGLPRHRGDNGLPQLKTMKAALRHAGGDEQGASRSAIESVGPRGRFARIWHRRGQGAPSGALGDGPEQLSSAP